MLRTRRGSENAVWNAAISSQVSIRAGGLTESLKIAHIAQAWHLPLAPHIHGSVVAVAAAVDLLGAIPNASMAEIVCPAHPLMAELVTEPLMVDQSGHIELSERAGLGIELDPRVVTK